MIEINNGEFIITNIYRSKIETSMRKDMGMYQNFFRIDCPLDGCEELNTYLIDKLKKDEKLTVKTIDEDTGKVIACYMENAAIDRIENDFTLMQYAITFIGDVVYPPKES